MTLRFCDSFDHYATGDIARKWTSNSGMEIVTGGRRGTNCMRTAGGTAANALKTLTAKTTWILGAAVYYESAFDVDALPILMVLDAGTTQCHCTINPDGTLSIVRNATILGTSAFALSVDAYYFIEFKVTIGNSGSASIRVNGDTKLSVSSVDTQNTSNSTANQVRVGFGALGAGVGIRFEDFYACDSDGSTNNDFLGDRRVDAYYPTGNGNSSQLTGSDGNSTDNYLLVDENDPDDDSTYVESSTSGQKDTYAFQNMSHTPASINGLQINLMAKKDDAGARSIASVIRSGGSDTDGTTQALSTSYVDYLQISETDPNTAAAWTQSGFDGAEFGVKVAA